MLEFYYNYYPKSFKSKSKQLANEISFVLKNEGIKVAVTEDPNIPKKYKELLGNNLF